MSLPKKKLSTEERRKALEVLHAICVGFRGTAETDTPRKPPARASSETARQVLEMRRA